MFIPNLFQPFSSEELNIEFESVQKSEEIKEKLVGNLIQKWNSILPKQYEYSVISRNSNGGFFIHLRDHKSRGELCVDLVRSLNQFIMPNEFQFFLAHFTSGLKYQTDGIFWHDASGSDGSVGIHDSMNRIFSVCGCNSHNFLEEIKINLFLMDMKRLFDS